MGDKTGIEWTDATWNPLAGCSLVSPGCTNCYAMGHAARLLDKPGSHYEGTTKRVIGKAVWTGKIGKAPDHIMAQPLRWKRPRMVFVNSMSDLFHEDVPDEWIDEVFAVMALCPQHTFQILTKRPERMREYTNDPNTISRIYDLVCDMVLLGEASVILIAPEIDETKAPPGTRVHLGKWPLPNVWLGVSVEDQRRANERIRYLLNTPAAVRFLSMEPLVGAVDLNQLTGVAVKDPDKVPLVAETCLYNVLDRPAILPAHDTAKIDWVIVGGESGHDARPMHPDWVRYTRDQCVTAGVPFFFKQWGEFHPAADHDPEKCKKEPVAIHISGVREYMPSEAFRVLATQEEGWAGMCKVGKGKSGRTLDGRTWDEMPGRWGK